MAYRSEQNNIGNKQNYRDLNLTQYPNTIDSRTNNTNMRGFINVGEGQIPDYVMAEYVNAAIDGVMALERAVGEAPMVPFDTEPGNTSSVIESSTVAKRISRIEDGLFDERYGGAGWKNVPTRPTLSKHNHDGLNGHPNKIKLGSEVEGLLEKKFINLTAASGLTGADIFVSKQNPIKINEAINDALSKSAGGTVSAPVTFTKSVKHRTHIDLVADEMTINEGATLISDSQATSGKALRYTSSSTVGTVFSLSAKEKEDLLFGKYILAVRVKSSASDTTSAIRFQLGSQAQTIKNDDIGKNYKQLYFVFEQDATTKKQDLIIQKIATTASVSITIDSIYIEPIHPAVLDR